MPKETRMESSRQFEATIAALRGAYEAFNRGDIDAALQPLDPQIEWTEPVEFPGGGTYHGHDGVKRYLTQSRAAWAEVSSEPERFITAGNRIVVFVHARVRPKGSNQWQDVRLADVYTVRGGKVLEMRAFADRQEALRWAGVQSPVPDQPPRGGKHQGFILPRSPDGERGQPQRLAQLGAVPPKPKAHNRSRGLFSCN
jgi:ketosteroid isomerase-like protein